MIRHLSGQIETTKPAVSEVEMDLFAEAALRPDAHGVADQQHPGHQSWINRRWPGGAVERCQVLPDAGQVNEPIHRSEHMVGRHMRFNREFVEQSPLRFLPGPHHRRSPPTVTGTLNQRLAVRASRVFQQNRL